MPLLYLRGILYHECLFTFVTSTMDRVIFLGSNKITCALKLKRLHKRYIIFLNFISFYASAIALIFSLIVLKCPFTQLDKLICY